MEIREYFKLNDKDILALWDVAAAVYRGKQRALTADIEKKRKSKNHQACLKKLGGKNNKDGLRNFWRWWIWFMPQIVSWLYIHLQIHQVAY